MEFNILIYCIIFVIVLLLYWKLTHHIQFHWNNVSFCKLQGIETNHHEYGAILFFVFMNVANFSNHVKLDLILTFLNVNKRIEDSKKLFHFFFAIWHFSSYSFMCSGKKISSGACQGIYNKIVQNISIHLRIIMEKSHHIVYTAKKMDDMYVMAWS